MSYSVAILIISDRAASGERADGCLPEFESALSGTDFEISESAITSDDPAEIRKALRSFIEKECQLIFTSGGTGCGPRDNTPEVTSELIDKFTPGVDSALRDFSRTKSKFAIYSRSVSGVAGKSFVVNLPGSPKAVAELVPFLLTTISHPLRLISGQTTDCADE